MTSYNILFDLLSDAFLDEAQIPKNISKTMKVITKLGLSYYKIDVSPKDCMLCDRNLCLKCDMPR